MAFICDGCATHAFTFQQHHCQREVLRAGADISIRCDCSTHTSCAGWVPAEMTGYGITVSGRLPHQVKLEVHRWVPDTTEPWCERCLLTVTAAIASPNGCVN